MQYKTMVVSLGTMLRGEPRHPGKATTLKPGWRRL